MRVLLILLLLLVAPFALVAMIPVLTVGIAFAAVCGGFLIWLLPIFIIASSERTTGGEKLAWILAIVFLSWFAWIFYFLLAPIKERTGYDDDRDYRPYRRRRHHDYRYD